MPARKVTENKAQRVSVTLDGDDHARLLALSKKSDRSVAYLIREAVRDYLTSSSPTQVGGQR